MYVIMKNGSYVKDFSDGKEFTKTYTWMEMYSSEKYARLAAQRYGRMNGKGYKVVKLY